MSPVKDEQATIFKATVSPRTTASQNYSPPPPTPMYPRAQRKVFANAIILTDSGSSQHNPQKPWLFRYPIHEKQNVILYTDLERQSTRIQPPCCTSSGRLLATIMMMVTMKQPISH